MYAIKNLSGQYLHRYGTADSPRYRWGTLQGAETWDNLDEIPDEITISDDWHPEREDYGSVTYDVTFYDDRDIRLHYANVSDEFQYDPDNCNGGVVKVSLQNVC